MSFNNYFSIINKYKSSGLLFYSEGKHHSEHLFPIAKELLKRKKVLYVTSDESDPVLKYNHHNLISFFIGTGAARNLFFENVSCKIFITSLPDLDKYAFKKSKYAPYYIYVHHSIVSSHMAYREAAFDAFNEIFCVGPHHINEITQQEKLFDLPKKILTAHGNAKIDQLAARKNVECIKNSILIAPSWGSSGLFEKYIEEIIEICKKNKDFLFILRPHSETIRKCKNVDNILSTLIAPNIIYDQDPSNEWFLKSEIMISDWSGAAYEFIFGLERPVIFINTEKKLNNEKYTSLDIEPFEVANRKKFGMVVNPEELHNLSDLVNRVRVLKLPTNKDNSEYVYNLGKSVSVAANTIFQRINYMSKDLRKKLKENCTNYDIDKTEDANHHINTIENCLNQIRKKTFDSDFINKLVKKIDVSKRLYNAYDDSWMKSVNARELFKYEILIVCFYLLESFDFFRNKNKAISLKISNSILNVCNFDEHIKEEYLDFFKESISSELQ